VYDVKTRDTTLGVHLVDLPTTELPSGRRIDFTFDWTDAGRWEGVDFAVFVE
jgi:glucoamylase